MDRASLSGDYLRRIFGRSGGKCHLCFKRLDFGAYGALNADGAWEIDHSRPRAFGGSDHLNNLYPACPSCNRSKGTRSARAVRAEAGYTQPPASEAERQAFRRERAFGGAVWGALGAAAFGLGPLGVLGGALLVADLSAGIDPDSVRAIAD